MALDRLLAEHMTITYPLVSLLAIFSLLCLKGIDDSRACFEK